jgi:hypothetical protein
MRRPFTIGLAAAWCLLASHLAVAQAPSAVEGEADAQASPQADDDEGPRPVFAFVPLNKLTRPTEAEVLDALKKSLPKDAKIEDVEIDDEGVTFTVDGQVAMFGILDRPIPWTDLELPCQASWIWPEATESLKDHEAHLIVFTMSREGTHLERNVLVTKLLAAAASCFDAAGVYWGHGSVVLSPEHIQKMAEDASVDEPPILVWVNFFRQKNEDGSITLFTEGLEYFDCMEIEIVASRQPIGELFNAAMGVAYITLKGEVIADGDTIGPDAESKIKTRHAPSVHDKEKKVLRIEM